MKVQLDTLFDGITASRQKVNRIAENGNCWRISFVDNRIADLDVMGRNVQDISTEIRKHAGVQK